MTLADFSDRLKHARTALDEGRLRDTETDARAVLNAEPNNSDALFLLGAVALRTGQAEMASQLLMQSVNANTRNFDAYLNLGLAFRVMQHKQDSLNAFQRAQSLKPSSDEANFCLGLAIIETGDLANAQKFLERAVKIAPNNAAARSALAGLLVRRGDTEGSLKHFRKGAVLRPDDADAQVNYAMALQSQADHDGAVPHFRRTLALKPDAGDAALGLAISLSALGQTEEAEALFRTFLAARPDFPLALFNLGQLLKGQRRLDEAVVQLRAAAAATKNDPRMVQGLAEALVMAGKADEAIALLKVPVDPKAELAAHIGIVQLRMGRFDEAGVTLERVLARNPAHVAAMVALSGIASCPLKPEIEQRMKTLADDKKTPTRDRVRLMRALARLLDSRGDYANAFVRASAAGDLRASEVLNDAAEHREAADRTIQMFTAKFLQEHAALGSDSPLPVFVTGMPRSGAALLDRVIGAHPKGFGAGELDDLSQIVHRLPALTQDTRPFPVWVGDADPAAVHRLAAELVARRQALAPKAERVSDKGAHHMLLGFMHLLFPRAAILHVHRDPMDACLSAMFNDVGANRSYAVGLRWIGNRWREYERMMAHWRGLVPMFEVNYEDLVQDFPGNAAKAVAYTGLPWDPSCLNMQTVPTAITSTTVWRLRQPVDATRVGWAKNYDKWLGPLKGALEGK